MVLIATPRSVFLLRDSLRMFMMKCKGMGKYFVTLAKQVGYERTLLLLGRHLRYLTPST